MIGKNIRIPKFMEGEPLPKDYYETPDPYQNPPSCSYNIPAMINYAMKYGKRVTDLTREEAKQFLIED